MPTYAPIGKATFRSEGSFTYYELLSDGDDIVTSPGLLQIAAGIQKRGAILKWDPATTNVTVPAVETDANCILADDTDPTSAIAPCNIYRSGKFKADAVIWPGALSHALITDALRKVTILIESVMYTDGSLVKTEPSQAEAENARKVIEENKQRAKDVKKAAEEEEKIPPRDSPYAYLTEDEKEKSPELADIHDRENEEKAAAEKEKEPGKQPPPPHNPAPHTPPSKTPPPRKSGEGD